MTYHGTNFNKSLLIGSFLNVTRIQKFEEFFRLEQKNMSVSDYEKKFLELIRLVPYIQANEALK